MYRCHICTHILKYDGIEDTNVCLYMYIHIYMVEKTFRSIFECHTVQHCATHCSTLQHTVTIINSYSKEPSGFLIFAGRCLQNATHWNMLQHTFEITASLKNRWRGFQSKHNFQHTSNLWKCGGICFVRLSLTSLCTQRLVNIWRSSFSEGSMNSSSFLRKSLSSNTIAERDLKHKPSYTSALATLYKSMYIIYISQDGALRTYARIYVYMYTRIAMGVCVYIYRCVCMNIYHICILDVVYPHILIYTVKSLSPYE